MFLVFVFGGGVLPLLYVNQDHSPGSNRLQSRYRLRLVRGVCLVYCISQFIVLYRLDIIYMTLSLSNTTFPLFLFFAVFFEPSLSTSHAVSSLPLTTPTTYFFCPVQLSFFFRGCHTEARRYVSAAISVARVPTSEKTCSILAPTSVAPG